MFESALCTLENNDWSFTRLQPTNDVLEPGLDSYGRMSLVIGIRLVALSRSLHPITKEELRMTLYKWILSLSVACFVGCSGMPTSTHDAGVCVDNVLCVQGSHFDNRQCKCVPNADAGSTCVQTVLCVVGDHFDSNLCKCVPN